MGAEPHQNKSVYIQVYLILIALLAMTVGVVFVNLGPFTMLLTMAIAVTKALLVIVFFMHARYSPRLIWIYFALGIIWIGQLIGGVLIDITTRI